MDDNGIIDLYFQRSENAVAETHAKYGRYCYSIAYNILANREDSEESVNDTYLAAWNAMPPRRPPALAAFLGKLTRNNAINRWHARTACKRGGGEITVALDELEECVCSGQSVEDAYAHKEAVRSFNCFLGTLRETERNVFLRRYWFLDTIGEIASSFGFSESKVKSMLHRTRQKLRRQLEKEGLL